jgi:hypothetical protein
MGFEKKRKKEWCFEGILKQPIRAQIVVSTA